MNRVSLARMGCETSTKGCENNSFGSSRALRITRAEPYLAALVRDPMADRLPGMLAHGELSRDDVQLEDRGSAMRPHIAVDLRADQFIGAQSLVGLDEHRIRFSRVPIDDFVLVLPLRFTIVLHEHAHVFAVGIDRHQPSDREEIAPITGDGAKPAQQASVRGPMTPRQ
jgi:hypothetical protein